MIKNLRIIFLTFFFSHRKGRIVKFYDVSLRSTVIKHRTCSCFRKCLPPMPVGVLGKIALVRMICRTSTFFKPFNSPVCIKSPNPVSNFFDKPAASWGEIWCDVRCGLSWALAQSALVINTFLKNQVFWTSYGI